MEYYQYQEPPQNQSNSIAGTDAQEQSGKVIDPTPILRLLLEPRSLVITHGYLYTRHLHGISGTHCDVFAPSTYEDLNTLIEEHRRLEHEVQVTFARDIANRGLLGSEILRNQFAQAAESTRREKDAGEVICLKRQTRTSLTCRVVEKTSTAVGKLLKLR
jgi:hypothetical protein